MVYKNVKHTGGPRDSVRGSMGKAGPLREPVMGVWGVGTMPQLGPRAEPLVRRSGDEAP